MTNEWGPLGALAGEWQGEGGLDTAFSHAANKVLGTPYLEKCTLSYEVTITVGVDTWSYDETTMLRMNEFDEPFAHTDHNTLRRVG
jgi:hypothetical protein